MALGRLPELGFEVGAELGQEAEHRPGGRLAERADGVAGDAVRDIGQQLDVAGLALAARQAVAYARQPAGGLAARRALAARLVRVELHDAPAQRDDVRRI